MAKKKNPNAGLTIWIEARKRYHLSHARVQMARARGMTPKKFSGLANHKQEPWKQPLPQFIEQLCEKRFGQPRPDVVLSIEERARLQGEKKAARRATKNNL